MSLTSRTYGVLVESDSIDAESSGSTVVVETDNDLTGTQTIYPTLFIFETVTASGVTKNARISVGSNSPNYDDMVDSHRISTTAGNFDVVAVERSPKIVHPGEIRVNVFDPATATALTFRVSTVVASGLDSF
jgi:hypothetical protein